MVSKRLKVLQLLPALSSGGVERGTLEVGKFLVERGHESMVMSAGGRMVAQLESEGSRHFTWPIGRKSLKTLRLIPQLRAFLTEHEVDILHCRSRLPAWIGFLAWKGMPPQRRPRFVTTVHGFYSVGYYSSVMTRGERVIAVSDAVSRYVRTHYLRRDAEALRVIHRGIDHHQYPADYRPANEWLDAWHAQFPQLKGKRLVVLAGRLTRLKGHPDFIYLLSQLKSMFPDLHGLIVGEAEARHAHYLEELKATAVRFGVSDALTFTGHRNDLREIFAASSLVVSLSTQPEAFGRTVLEALTVGTPVVAYAHGGVGEILGSMFPQGKVTTHDIDAAVQTCRRILESQLMPGPLPSKFRLDAMLQGTLDVYNELTINKNI